MAFSDSEKLSIVSKLTQQIESTTDSKYWFNELFGWAPITPLNKIWQSFNDIPPATNPSEADTNVTNNPTILEKRKIRLTADVTSNYGAYVARTTYNDNSSPIYENWIQPALIRDGGDPSNGYVAKLFHGDPDSGGTEISTIYHAGTGGAPCWAYSYTSGILFISGDEANHFKTTFYDINGLWIYGYRYIGATGIVSSTGDAEWYVEKFPVTQAITSTGQVDLTYTPINNSETVKLNGLDLVNDVSWDYTISGTLITFGNDLELTVGDYLVVKYEKTV